MIYFVIAALCALPWALLAVCLCKWLGYAGWGWIAALVFGVGFFAVLNIEGLVIKADRGDG